MKSKETIQQRINTLNKEIDIHRKDLHSNEYTSGHREVLNTIDRLRVKKDLLEWVLDLDSKE